MRWPFLTENSSWLTHLNVKLSLENIQYSKYRPGLEQRTISTPLISTADDERNVFFSTSPRAVQLTHGPGDALGQVWKVPSRPRPC